MTNVLIRRGVTIPFEQLPPRAIALDGYVQGPAIDAATERYSFDHHAGCVRHATLSTCEMSLDAARVGLDPRSLTLFLNDLDPDTILATWILLRVDAAANERVAQAIRAAGRVDALGPAVGGAGLVPALAWALAPWSESAVMGELRFLSDDAYRGVLDACLERLDRWLAQGAPSASSMMPPPERAAPRPPVVLHEGRGWKLVESAWGSGTFAALYVSGVRAGIVARPLRDGTTLYVVGKASEFVRGFDVPAILRALRDAEREANPEQLDAHSWGGGSTIGGSPRNPDGSASCLPWPRVAEVVDARVTE